MDKFNSAFYDKEDMATSELNKTVQKVEEVSKKIKTKLNLKLYGHLYMKEVLI